MTGIILNLARLVLPWVVLLLCSVPVSMAERLYHWTDETGQIHITQEPPPRKGQLQEIMDYSGPSEPEPKTETLQPANVRDPLREEKILLELEKSRLEGTESALREYDRERSTETVGPNSCFVELPAQDMYVRVFDMAESGSRGHRIWGGQMKKFEKKLFNSRRGRVSIDFKAGPRESYNTIEVRICTNGNVIQLLPR